MLELRSLAILLSLAPIFCASLACNAESAVVSEQAAWSVQSSEQLLYYLENTTKKHGLDPSDYAPHALRQAIRSGNLSALEEASDQSFRTLASDLLGGKIPRDARSRAHFPELASLTEEVELALADVRENGNCKRVLDALAPQHQQYRKLQAALHNADGALHSAIRVNLERWRWLPRNLGDHYILVNLPAYSLALIAGEREIARHRIIIGKVSTPTLQFSTQVDGIILNPTWTVPRSIVAESIGHLIRANPRVARARGYTWSYVDGRLQVVQKPGPENALGLVKLDMPNPFTIYVHDTPSKHLFDEDTRTFSHGCVRMDDAIELAKTLLGTTGGINNEVDLAIADGKTRRIALSTTVPIYIIYITTVAGVDGQVEFLGDPYDLDAALASHLEPMTGRAVGTSPTTSQGGCA